jgi:hypothetical protein
MRAEAGLYHAVTGQSTIRSPKTARQKRACNLARECEARDKKV